MAINVSVQYNGGLLPDIILLTQRYYHRVTRLNAMKRFCLSLQPSKRFDILGDAPEGLDAFIFFSWTLVKGRHTTGRLWSMCVCVCVFFPSILDIKFVGRTSRGHTGGRSHRIFNPPSFCGACLDFCREKDSAIPFPRRP